MNLAFDFEHDVVVEFGVGVTGEDIGEFAVVPVDENVQGALLDMAFATRDAMDEFEEVLEYEPSEVNSGSRYVTTALANPWSEQIRQIYAAENLALQPQILNEPAAVYCYFARFYDTQGRRILAMRRATQFKGVLKSRLIRIVDDAMRLVDEHVFKLDKDFDFLADETTVHILRPGGFEILGRLHEAVISAVTANVAAIEQDLPFIDFSSISEYAMTHTRAAKTLAAIQSKGRSEGIDKDALCEICNKTGVVVHQVDEKLVIDHNNVVAFLEVLDRRRYELRLVPQNPESYRATSRQSI